MKIQIISNNKVIKSNVYEILYSSFSRPITFDLFDINIIDLQDEDLWKNDREEEQGINCSNDLGSLHKLIENSKKSKIIILFPLNYLFEYYLSCRGGYYNKYYLKDNIGNLKIIMGDLIPEIENYDFIYENSLTECGNSVYSSAFCFSLINEYALTKAEGSGKATTLQITDKCILTTLKLCDSDCSLKDFLDAIGLKDVSASYPQWLTNLEKFDDKAQNETIIKSESQIVELQKGIKEAQDKLQKNLRLKSILTENSDNLVTVVFDILEDILSCDLSGFKDEKREDFLIKLESYTFIGEIKGINTNVKNENISQLDVHYQSYLEKLEEEQRAERVKALLIINPQRNKPISERDEVCETQIKLAIRNGSLIVPTISLLTIYEKFLKNEITTEQIIDIFNSQVGLININ